MNKYESEDNANQSLKIFELSRGYLLSVVFTNNVDEAQKIFDELKFFSGDISILTFPDWEILPYDKFSPHKDIVSERISVLYELLSLNKPTILLVAISTAMHRILPKKYVFSSSLNLKKNDQIDFSKLCNSLAKNGYRNVDQVFEHGEFVVRGSILDIFPMGSNSPYRIDFFGNEIDSIRTFDEETQRSSEEIDCIEILPAKECPVNKENIKFLRKSFENRFGECVKDTQIYQDISNGISFSGIEYYIPLFFEEVESIFDYLPKNTIIITLGDIHKSAENFWKEINEQYEQIRYDKLRPVLSPKELYLTVPDFFAEKNKFKQSSITKVTGQEVNIDLTIKRHNENPLKNLDNFLKSNKKRVIFCVESAGRKEALLILLKKINVSPMFCLTWKDFLSNDCEYGISINEIDRCVFRDDLVLIPESMLFEQKIIKNRRTARSEDSKSSNLIRDISELKVGDPVVHIDYGIGRYLGLQIISEAEYLSIEYADQIKLYIPISSLNLVTRYLGADSKNVEYNKLGTKQWEKTKQKALEKIRDVAADLLEIYAKRSSAKGFAFKIQKDQYDVFASDFPFETTTDQQKAIDDVIFDMTSKKCMDRLICGDVGFGKTEVAMRAAFIAVCSNKQVAILVPTTILAQQHYQTFKNRFANWPVNIGLLSRFTSIKEQKELIVELETGKIDIIIGTHKLLQPNIKFKDLRLLVIDEEHRFGVKQKEKIKSLRANIDILTLTATPIPRTLNISLSGMRDLSVISTAPAKRLAIKTFVRERNKNVIKEAISREILRGGQVYFLHNNIETINNVAQEIERLMPEARVAIAHGKLNELQLETVMRNFYQQRCNILICTTIVESGIDIPTANTIIIDRADMLGLAQLHQIRGRVGRSHHQAYAYLLIPSREAITADAIKRLEAIESMEDLGSGFVLAMHDLEIRGAGEILGEDQSGQIHSIGFNLYIEFLEQAVNLLKSGKEFDKDFSNEIEIDIGIPALIPENYVHDVSTRLSLYKRISSASPKSIYDLQVELVDRFGLLPFQVKNLIKIREIKFDFEKIGIKKIKSGVCQGFLEFIENPKINPANIVNLIQKYPKIYKFENPNKLRFNFVENKNSDDLFNSLNSLIKCLVIPSQNGNPTYI